MAPITMNNKNWSIPSFSSCPAWNSSTYKKKKRKQNYIVKNYDSKLKLQILLQNTVFTKHCPILKNVYAHFLPHIRCNIILQIYPSLEVNAMKNNQEKFSENHDIFVLQKILEKTILVVWLPWVTNFRSHAKT